ncbi:MAG: 30S ribosomal protein S12 methylthiotransferase RimO [Calditrichaeota bacterium]|nr:30S ribosomal protein S12 methylthiotransferase RimO [Calditrichota bacterium]
MTAWTAFLVASEDMRDACCAGNHLLKKTYQLDFYYLKNNEKQLDSCDQGTCLGGIITQRICWSEKKMKHAGRKSSLRIAIHTLGCAKNLVDSERLAGILCSAGAQYVSQSGRADVLIVNTCGFVDDAKEESVHVLLEALRWKEQKAGRRVLAMGCLSQRDGAELAREMPELDGVFGVADWLPMMDALKLNPLGNGRIACAMPANRRLLSSPGSAYLRISDGCSMGCSFCAIAQMRGYLRSEPIERLVAEATALAETGVCELILIGQETTSYGVDLYGRRMLIELLWRLSEISGIRWLRLLYLHPPSATPRFLQELAGVPKLCGYLDFPIEHASEKILRRMNRRATAAQMKEAIAAFRQARPDACVRTSVIVGFPGETEADFEQLYSFMEEVRFERAGVFIFSPQDGTAAAAFPERVEEGIALERLEQIMKLQRRICREKHARFVGRTLDVLVERSRDTLSYGRTEWDAPEVDCEVRICGKLPPGEMVPVRISDASDYRLQGTALKDEKKIGRAGVA